MSKIQISLTALAAMSIVVVAWFYRCFSSTHKITIPVDSKVSFEDAYTIIWNE